MTTGLHQWRITGDVHLRILDVLLHWAGLFFLAGLEVPDMSLAVATGA